MADSRSPPSSSESQLIGGVCQQLPDYVNTNQDFGINVRISDLI
jgi:hypothetical protein